MGFDISKILLNKRASAYQGADNLKIASAEGGNNLVQSFKQALKHANETSKIASENYNSGFIKTNINGPAKLSNDILRSLSNALGNAQDLSVKTVNRSESVADAVSAVMHAQTLMKTIVTVRDKIVSSYLDIAKMPI